MNPDKPFEDATWIIPGLVAIGNHVAARDKLLLRSMRIASILSLTESLRGIDPVELGVRIVEIVVLKDEGGNDPKLFCRAVDTVAELVEEAAPVLVHCHAGRSRSPVVVAGYLMRAFGLSAEEALARVKAKRETSVSPGMEQLLYDVE